MQFGKRQKTQQALRTFAHAKLLWTCYRETGVTDFGLITALLQGDHFPDHIKFPDFSLTTLEFPDFSRFSRWVVTLLLADINTTTTTTTLPMYARYIRPRIHNRLRHWDSLRLGALWLLCFNGAGYKHSYLLTYCHYHLLPCKNSKFCIESNSQLLFNSIWKQSNYSKVSLTPT